MSEEHDTDLGAFEGELRAAIAQTVQLRRELDAIEVGLARVVEMFLQRAGNSDLATDFLRGLGPERGTLH
jgi:hypothetical protein